MRKSIFGVKLPYLCGTPSSPTIWNWSIPISVNASSHYSQYIHVSSQNKQPIKCDKSQDVLRCFGSIFTSFNPSIGTLKLQSNGPLYSNAVIGTLAVDGWAVIQYSEEGPGQAAAPPSPLIAVPNVNSPPINGQCTNFALFNVAL